MKQTIPIPALPVSPDDLPRVEMQRLRRRVMTGAWQRDLIEAARRQIGTDRLDTWGDVDMSSNLARTTFSKLAVLYDIGVTIRHPDESAASRMTRILDRVGWRTMMQRVQLDALGINEMLVHVEARAPAREGRPPDLVMRRVYPDVCEGWSDLWDPGQPYRLIEWRYEERAGQYQWIGYDHDLTDADAPAYRVIDANRRTIETREWPIYAPDGAPVMPYVCYHSAHPGSLWDPYMAREVFDATIQTGVHWSHWSHIMRAASWPQRYVVNATPAADLTETPTGKTAHMDADPTMVIALRAIPSEDGTPASVQVGQWMPGADPAHMQQAISAYEQRGSEFAGVPASELRAGGGDPRSGYALAVSKAAKREASAKYAPIFEAVDQRLLRVVASAWQHYGGIPLPLTGWRVEYHLPAPSPEEEAQRRAEAVEMLERRLFSRAEARAYITGETIEEARANLALIDAEGNPAPTPIPTMTPQPEDTP
jgi:hypothetical protein